MPHWVNYFMLKIKCFEIRTFLSIPENNEKKKDKIHWHKQYSFLHITQARSKMLSEPVKIINSNSTTTIFAKLLREIFCNTSLLEEWFPDKVRLHSNSGYDDNLYAISIALRAVPNDISRTDRWRRSPVGHLRGAWDNTWLIIDAQKSLSDRETGGVDIIGQTKRRVKSLNDT